MITVKIKEDDLLEMLTERLRYWTDEEDTIDAYREFYQAEIDNGFFDGIELDIQVIVDNDWVNYTQVYDNEQEALDAYGCKTLEELENNHFVVKISDGSIIMSA